ncbi:hypothetical protein UFOVP121_32 [uncultured Caudovirales phage]|uniref:Uncharacterized protein n=1 Tax=uncultured Caudovirales phage TaxID=2100421 RepID=A0A6J5LL98_9CAUD|nr:hypothetical protein UFOVP121_32 [uncultured Caudovirales phage]CAB4134941.1 hypothetical protein UFOVP277_37 [uncultured Caudovirales phage]
MAMNSSGDMSAMAPWLDRKYANMEQQTANQGMESAATADLKSAQASMTPLDVVSQAGLRGAQANYANQQAAMHPLEVQSMAGLRGQQSSEIGYRNRFSGFLDKFGLTPAEDDARRDPSAVKNMLFGIGSRAGFNKGTAKVMKKGETRVTDEDGNGHPRVDTVPAMLAEGEAVLNAGAAERMGRDEIRQLNKQGLRDMKMDSGERPVLKKGGRIGPFTGLAMGSDGTGVGLRCGSDMVMKYADGTSDAGTGGHGSPDSPSAVNMAGTMGGRGRNMGAKFVGGRGYADGIDHVPAESETELDNFERQRDRNETDEAVPAGTPVGYEAAGQQGSVTPSRDTARLRQAFGLTAQGFANGTADVQALQPAQDPDMVYAADGTENIFSRAFGAAKDLGGRAAEGLRGLTQAAPVDLGTVGAAPTSAAEAATAARTASAMGAPAAASVGPGSTIYTNAAGQAFNDPNMGRYISAAAEKQAAAQAAQTGGRGLAFEAGQATGKAVSGLRNMGVGAAPVVGGALTAGQALSEMPTEFYNDPNVPAHEKFQQGLRTFARSALPYAGGAIGSGIAPVAGTIGGAAVGGALASQIDQKGEALSKWEAARAAESAKAVSPAAQPAAPAAKTEQQAAAPKLTLRGLATMGTMMGHTGAASVLRDLTDRETNAVSAANKAGKLSEVQIFDPATLDAKTNEVKPGVERKDLSEQFNSQYMPMYAQQRAQANPGEKLTPAQLQAEAQLSFNMNRAAEEYGLKSGKGFNFTRPILPNRTKFVSDLDGISLIIGRARGENEWKEGIFDKGGIVVTDGLEKQILPIRFLDEKWLNSPDMSLKVKSLIKENSAK